MAVWCSIAEIASARNISSNIFACTAYCRGFITDERPRTNIDCKLGEENVQEVISKTSDKFVQALITHKFRSKAVQAGPKYKDQALSPLKPSLVSSFTSPFKVKTFKKSRPSEMGKITRNIFTEDEPSDGEILYTQEISGVTHLLCIHCKPNHLLTAAKYLKITRNNNKLRRLYRTH
ncbi:hypothetical protein EVAR_10612_1 [Eumeta japonica]|uniref:Uncharacterized protein n=1 Tax=Eumeta variegata TaxID=151549 RepID=A0A4C1U2H9_EUMVA|nr:hypothetical protein EVAR_10612_1 [Eumeta japonica]